MIIYRDIITGDEVASDSYPIIMKYEGRIMEINGKFIVKDNNFVLEGANPSAEEQEETLEESTEKVIDIVDAHKLQEVPPMPKKEYMALVKTFMKKVAKKMEEDGKSEEEIGNFKKNAVEAVGDITKRYKDYQFFVGESLNPDALPILCNFREDGTTPYFTYFMDGLIEEKC